MHNYASPPDFFWDENYHVASAQKYLNGTFFMEPHPPLGKMVIALGELIIDANPEDNQFLQTDYGRKIPPGFSFAGYRFFPTLLGWLCAPLFFFILFRITKNNLWAVLLSFVYIFDNALIVHQRSAMLESTLQFFALAMIALWLILVQTEKTHKRYWWLAIACGATFGAALATKANGLILILLWPMLGVTLVKQLPQFAKATACFIGGFLVVYCSIWFAHFAIATAIEPALPDAGYYQASDTYKEYIDNETTANPLHFPVMLRDSWAFLTHYANGVPTLNLCKEGENGSPWFYWPVGGRSINYRWKTPANTDYYQYLYLQANPVVWLFGIVGIFGAMALLFAHVFLPVQQKIRQHIPLITFTGIYVSYMIVMARIDRVMYLYHYFLPLLFSLLLFAIVATEAHKFLQFNITAFARTIALIVCSASIFAAYVWYRPLTYYEPISDASVQKLAILPIWDLTCVRCQKNRYLHPTTCSE